MRAHLLQQLGRVHEAEKALQKALMLTEDEAVRAFLQRSSQRQN